jgi:hypothetical protein
MERIAIISSYHAIDRKEIIETKRGLKESVSKLLGDP